MHHNFIWLSVYHVGIMCQSVYLSSHWYLTIYLSCFTAMCAGWNWGQCQQLNVISNMMNINPQLKKYNQSKLLCVTFFKGVSWSGVNGELFYKIFRG